MLVRPSLSVHILPGTYLARLIIVIGTGYPLGRLTENQANGSDKGLETPFKNG